MKPEEQLHLLRSRVSENLPLSSTFSSVALYLLHMFISAQHFSHALNVAAVALWAVLTFYKFRKMKT